MDYKDYQCDSQGIELNELEELFEDARYNKEEFNSEDIRKLYKIYLKGQEKNIEDIKQEINIDLNNLGEEFNSLESSEKKLLLSAMLVDKANIYKKLAEKILDSE